MRVSKHRNHLSSAVLSLAAIACSAEPNASQGTLDGSTSDSVASDVGDLNVASGGAGASSGASAGQLGSGGMFSTGGSSASGGDTSVGTETGGGSAAGGSAASGGSTSSGGTSAAGGSASGGNTGASGGSGGGSGGGSDPCKAAGLSWKTANKTNYTSYPDTSTPEGYEECYVYNGCQWAGWFAGCTDQQTEAWVASHNIAALFPNFSTYELHDICIRSGSKTMVVTVYDTCGDNDCSGCCTQNKGNKDALIDLESHTNARWGLPDGAIEWADLGPAEAPGCK